MGNLSEYLRSTNGAVTVCVIALLIFFFYVVVFVLKIRPAKILSNRSKKSIKFLGKVIREKEYRFNRDYEIGIISQKRAKYRLYRLMNDLTIDLGLKVKGVTPYELLFLLMVVSLLFSLVFGVLIFSNVVLGIISYPIMLMGIICAVYTKANIAHDSRIEAVIEAENIISNNISGGVKFAIEQSFSALPKEVKNEFGDFLNSLDEMTYIVTALRDLNNKLGSIADEFINKCIKFEIDEEQGTAGTFQDIVEMNNYKVQSRMKLKRTFEQITSEFVVSAILVMSFLCGVIFFYDIVYDFYFKTMAGQIIILFDILIFIGEFVYITYLRAQEI